MSATPPRFGPDQVALLRLPLSIEAPEGGERLPDHLIHIVIAVGRKAAHEGDAGSGIGQGLVFLEQRLVLRPRDRIIRIALRRRIFVGDAGLGMALAGQVLILGDPCVGHLRVGIIDHGDRLELGLVHHLMLEAQAPVGQLAVAKPDILLIGR